MDRCFSCDEKRFQEKKIMGAREWVDIGLQAQRTNLLYYPETCRE